VNYFNKVIIKDLIPPFFRHANLSAAEIIEKVYNHLLSFTKGTQQQDDLTVIVIKKL
jgi:serine phosphatase RsbU (regulator of sigma subunit)